MSAPKRAPTAPAAAVDPTARTRRVRVYTTIRRTIAMPQTVDRMILAVMDEDGGSYSDALRSLVKLGYRHRQEGVPR